MSTQRILRVSETLSLHSRQEGTEALAALSPGWLPSTRTVLPLRWDPDSTHASPASRCGAMGAPREEVLLEQQKTSNHGFLWGPRKTEFLS